MLRRGELSLECHSKVLKPSVLRNGGSGREERTTAPSEDLQDRLALIPCSTPRCQVHSISVTAGIPTGTRKQSARAAKNLPQRVYITTLDLFPSRLQYWQRFIYCYAIAKACMHNRSLNLGHVNREVRLRA